MKDRPSLNSHTLKFFFWGIVILISANIICYIYPRPNRMLVGFINLYRDNTVPGWYSAILLAVAGFLAYECFLYARELNITDGWKFLFIAGLLFLMSCDEIAKFHEVIGGSIARSWGIAARDFGKHAPWVWVLGPVIFALLLGAIFFLRKPLSLVPGSNFFLGLGIVFILAGGIVLESTINWLNSESLQWLWNIEIVLEELLEMIGTLSIAYAFMLWRDGIKDFAPKKY